MAVKEFPICSKLVKITFYQQGPPLYSGETLYYSININCKTVASLLSLLTLRTFSLKMHSIMNWSMCLHITYQGTDEKHCSCKGKVTGKVFIQGGGPWDPL